jgi:hypothetical protein
MTDITQDDIQSELERRNEKDRQNAYLIFKVTESVMSDWLKKTYGEKLPVQEKLMYSTSIRALSTDFMWQQWANRND